MLGDVDALAARLTAIVEHADTAAAAEKAKREEHRAAQTARKEALAAEAEELANNSVQWKAAGDRLREILEEWRTISGLDRKTDDALWKRYSAARETFNRRRGSHFAELDRERAGARQAKEALCERAEALADSTDWGPTAAAFRDLLTQWKAAGRASKDVDDALWQRFKAAQDTFFAARNAVSAERDAEFRANADAKEALLAEAEKLDTSDLDAARAALRTIGDKWDSDRQGAPRAKRRPGAAAARRGEEGAGRADRTASTRRLRPAPTNSASAQNNSSGRPRRPPRRAAPRMPRRRGPAPRSGDNGRRPLPRRSARRVSVSSGPSVPVSLSSSRLSNSPLFWRLATARRRSSSAASCSAVRAHTTRAQWNVSTITVIHAMISPMPGPGCGAGAVWRDHTASRPVKDATVDPASAIHARAQRLVNRASIEKPTPNTSASQVNTRDGSDTPSPIAASLPASTSQPLAPPVCGSTNVNSSTNTAMARTNALAPGSISRATRRSAASMSPLNSSKSPFWFIARRHRAHPVAVGRLCRCAEAGQAEANALRAPPGGVGIPGPGAPVVQHGAVGDQVVRRGVGHRGGDDVAGPDVGAHRGEVHQPAVACPSGHPGGTGVLASFSDGHQQLDGAADLGGVLLQRDPLLQVDETLIALLHNGFR